MGEFLTYGPTSLQARTVKVTVASGEVLKKTGGNFFTYNGSGKAVICTASTTTIAGFILAQRDETLTADTVFTAIIFDSREHFRIPINSGTFASTMVGKTCDLSVSSGVQGVALAASDRDLVRIIEGDASNNEWVIVQMNPAKYYATGVV